MAKEKEMDNHVCHFGMCHKCHGGKMLVLGIILLVNAFWPFLDWWKLIGILLVLGGIMKMVMPRCSHCEAAH